MPLPYVLPYAPLFWIVFVWAVAPEVRLILRARAAAEGDASPDAGSLRLIGLGMTFAFLAAFPLSLLQILEIGPGARSPAFGGGVLLLVAGSLLRRHCWRVLGSSFTFEVAVRPDQRVIDRGAYAWVRHPSYSGGILMNLGLGLALGSWASTALLVIVALGVYGYRIRVEERALRQTIGEPYLRYCAGHKRLIPYLF